MDGRYSRPSMGSIGLNQGDPKGRYGWRARIADARRT
nr:MAG TPA: hypothetical protein [Caudoviricetes sp.]